MQNKSFDERLNECREAALDVLKPSKMDLEHGLELHKNSTVCDTYGFAPCCPVDFEKLIKLAEAGCSPSYFMESKEEMQNFRHFEDKALYDEYVRTFKESGVTCIFQNAGVENQEVRQLMKRLAYFTYVTDKMPELFKRAAFPEDIDKAGKENRHCLYLSANAVPLDGTWGSAMEELSYIKVFFQMGIRMMHLTYNRRNMIGDGCAEKANAGLSDFGRSVVAEMNRTGVIVDIAHCGENTGLEAARISSKPIVASHTCASAINEHYRCKSDNVIKSVADSGGYVGICLIQNFLGGNGDINTLLDHISYIGKKFGADHVAIGSDVNFALSGFTEALERISAVRPKFQSWASFWPPEKEKRTFTERSSKSISWINWPMFTVGLVQRGFSDDEIKKIIGGNMLRVAKEALK